MCVSIYPHILPDAGISFGSRRKTRIVLRVLNAAFVRNQTGEWEALAPNLANNNYACINTTTA